VSLADLGMLYDYGGVLRAMLMALMIMVMIVFWVGGLDQYYKYSRISYKHRVSC
jgi:hypothetical protein